MTQVGRYIEVGKRDRQLNNGLEMGTFTGTVSFSSINLLQLEEHRGHDVHRVLKDVVNLWKEGGISPVEPITVYTLAEIDKTFRLMQAGKHMGKRVLSVKGDDIVPISDIYIG